MGSYIKFGGYNKNYNYIILTCIFNYLTYLVSLGYLKKILESLGIINKNHKDFSNHPYIDDIFSFIVIIIISIILFFLKEKKTDTTKENNEKNNNTEKNSSEILLIHNDIKEEIQNNISILNLIVILSYWVFIDHITKIIESLMILDYWMFELLFLSIMTSIFLKIKIYSHQKLGIIINSLSCLIFGIIRFYNIANKDKNLNIAFKWLFPISVIIYLIIVNSTSYIFTKLKFYMDLKFISLTKLLIYYGIIGFVFSTIACVIETSFKCVGNQKGYFCYVTSTDSNNKNSNDNVYIDNFFIYIEDFSKLNSKEKAIGIIIFVIETILYYCSLYFDLLIINYLTPMHFTFSSLIYLLLIELTQLIINKINSENEGKDNFSIINEFSIYIVSFIGFMIYLEIIELNFCKLNYNLRKYIEKRSDKEIYEEGSNESIISESEIEGTSPINDIEMPFNK